MKNAKKEWLIWSLEHEGWWMPNRCGYSYNILEAGTYTFEEAKEIVDKANAVCESKPNEAMVLETSMFMFRR